MKWTNEEMVCSAEDAIDEIEMAMSDISGIDEYEDIYITLKDIVEELKSRKEPYEEMWKEEQQAELDYLNYEYEKSRI